MPHQQTATEEGWVALCARAAVEQDPKRLLELVKEINRLLKVRRQRLTSEVTVKAHFEPAKRRHNP